MLYFNKKYIYLMHRGKIIGRWKKAVKYTGRYIKSVLKKVGTKKSRY